jgi:hypothetical protein
LVSSNYRDYNVYDRSTNPEKNILINESITITFGKTIPENARIETFIYASR